MTQDKFKRRLTAILIADVAGYSHLMGENETATVRILEKYKGIISELIGQHRGRVVHSAGGNLLAEFASVVDAAECAVTVQKELKVQNDELPLNRRMKFRIGVNFGDVIEEGSRIYGDSVNLAARIESLAEPGGVCLSRTAFDQIRTKLPYRYAFLGEHGVGNTASPVKVYKVLLESRATGHKTAGLRPQGTMWRLALIGTVAGLLVGGGVELWRFRPWPAAPAVEKAASQQMALPLPERPSVAVLPFVSLAEGPKAETLRLNPSFSLERYASRSMHKDPAVLERQIDAMRKAGLPAASGLKMGATAALEKPGDLPVTAPAPEVVYRVSLAGKSREAGVQAVTDEIIQKLRDTNRRISSLPSDFFKNGGMKTALANRLSAAMRDISDARYPEAMRTLDHDVLQRMDGCAQTRRPDRNDWMITCSAQENAYFMVTEAIDMLDELM